MGLECDTTTGRGCSQQTNLASMEPSSAVLEIGPSFRHDNCYFERQNLQKLFVFFAFFAVKIPA